jgi:hypothetical protein
MKPRHRPKFADGQATKILELLIQAGPRGVSKSFLIFQRGYTQAGARIFELEKQGYRIRHEFRPGDSYVTFILESPEPSKVSTPKPPLAELPLFDSAREQP